MKFRAAIKKQQVMDVKNISKDNCCDLGIWLHGNAQAKFGRLASLTDCVTKHAEFHTEAGRVAEAINAKQYTTAEAMLGEGTAYDEASKAVNIAIMQLKKEACL